MIPPGPVLAVRPVRSSGNNHVTDAFAECSTICSFTTPVPAVNTTSAPCRTERYATWSPCAVPVTWAAPATPNATACWASSGSDTSAESFATGAKDAGSAAERSVQPLAAAVPGLAAAAGDADDSGPAGDGGADGVLVPDAVDELVAIGDAEAAGADNAEADGESWGTVGETAGLGVAEVLPDGCG